MDRGVSPAIGVTLLAFLTVVLAVSVGVFAIGTDPTTTPTAQFSIDATADTQRIAIHHEGGDPIRVSEIDVQLSVDGESLESQPPVPFFAAEGFVTGPTGPFNAGGDTEWTAGETAAVRVAATNSPEIGLGSTITVTITSKGAVIYEETVTAT